MASAYVDYEAKNRLECSSNVATFIDTGFQFGEQHLQRLNAVLKAYEGTHNFHNFTPKMTGNDPTAKRYIISFSSPGKFTIRVIFVEKRSVARPLSLDCQRYQATFAE